MASSVDDTSMASCANRYSTDAPIDVPRRRHGLPVVRERMAPWLASAFVLAALNLAIVASGHELADVEQTLLLIGLCATLAAGGLVAARSGQELQQIEREERARPAVEELGFELGAASYVEGMARWCEAVLDLIEHAVSRSTQGTPDHAELTAAAADTAELRDLLRTGGGTELSINDTAMVHAVCTLWEVNEARVEELAAAVDRPWYRLWRARHVADRALRHGGTQPQPIVLPYRS